MGYILGALAFTIFATCNAGGGEGSTSIEATQQEPAQEEKKGMVFETEFHDFGKVEKGPTVEHVYSYVNESNEPLIINDHTVQCGCTVPTYTKGEAIAPGETGSVKVGFRSGVKNPGIHNKTVTFKTNQGNYTVRFKVEVTPKSILETK